MYRLTNHSTGTLKMPKADWITFFLSLAIVFPLSAVAEEKKDPKASDTLATLEQLAAADPKPFVIMEGSGKKVKNRSQGVVISEDGLVLTVGHIAWIEEDKSFTDQFRISFRGTDESLPKGWVHTHRTLFTDREKTPFFEYYYDAKLLNQENGSRFLADSDLALFQIEAKDDSPFPRLDFFSKTRPRIAEGDTLHLCHFNFPHNPADPLFLINPVEVVGVAQTPSGIQYLARGYYRIGSSGGALLKDGRLIGIQSAAYTTNGKDSKEFPAGLISFHLVWEDLVLGE